MEGGSQRLVVRLKKRTSLKTHSSSGFAESDWRATPPKTIKLLFPGVSQCRNRRDVGKQLGGDAVGNVRGLTGIGAVKVPSPGVI